MWLKKTGEVADDGGGRLWLSAMEVMVGGGVDGGIE